MAKIEYSRDLQASDAVYPPSCSVKLRTGSEFSDGGKEPPTKTRRTRQDNVVKEANFTKVVEYLEAND